MTEFSDIYVQYFTDVFKYVFSLCKNENIAEEITQETFFKALKSINSFKGNCKLRVWLCQIAKNTYFSFYEKEKKYTDNSGIEEKQSMEDFELKLINGEFAFELHKRLHKMDDPYKEVFSLRIFGELSFLQIGELFEKTESWARVTYHRAKIKLKEDVK